MLVCLDLRAYVHWPDREARWNPGLTSSATFHFWATIVTSNVHPRNLTLERTRTCRRHTMTLKNPVKRKVWSVVRDEDVTLPIYICMLRRPCLSFYAYMTLLGYSPIWGPGGVAAWTWSGGRGSPPWWRSSPGAWWWTCRLGAVEGRGAGLGAQQPRPARPPPPGLPGPETRVLK